MTATGIRYAQHADSGGSWYCAKERKQIIEVVGENGKPRKPTLRDARKHGWLPGVTGIIKCAAAPGLEKWKLGQMILAALTLSRQAEETDEQFVDRVFEDGQETARKAAEAGTAIHAAVQSYFEGGKWSTLYDYHVTGTINCLLNACGALRWTPEKLCFHRSYATKADLVSECGTWLLDMKSSDFDEQKQPDLKTYPTHHMQLAATRAALANDNSRFSSARCAILFVSRSNPGLASLVEVKERDLDRGLSMFSALHRYWCLDRDYFPGREDHG